MSVERPFVLTVVGVLFMLSSLLGSVIPDISPFHFILQVVIGVAVIKNLVRGRRWAWMALQANAAYNTALAVMWFDVLRWGVAAPILFSLSPLVLLWRPVSRVYFGAAAKSLDGALSIFQSPTRYRKILERIERFTAERKLEKALVLCRKVIEDLRSLKDLTPELRSCLGQAHLAQGRIFRQQDETWAAAQVYLTARLYISLPAEELSFLALQLAARKEESEKALDAYLEYLRLRRDLPAVGSDDSVYVFLQDLCRVEEDATPERLSSVRNLCRKVLEANDGLEWAQFSLGRSLFESGDLEGALCCFEASLRIRPDRREAAYFGMLCRGFLKEAKGSREEAMGLYRKAVCLVVDRPDAHYLMAKALVSECEEAEDQDAPDVAARIAQLAAEAMGAIVTAVAQRPNRAHYQFVHGRIQSFSGDSRAAIEAYRRGISFSPREKAYHLHLAIELGRLSEYDAALEAVERALSLDRSYVDAYRVRGDLLEFTGRHDLAAAEYRQAIELGPGHTLARLGLGCSLYRLGRYEEAAVELEQVMPRSGEATYLLARSYSYAGRFSEAIPLLENLASRADAGPDIFYYLGCARANTGQYITASEAFGACVKRETSRWQAHLQRGHCHLALREFGDAAADYEKVRELHPDGPEASIGLARCHLLSGSVDAARTMVEQLVQSHPASWEGHMLLGILAEKADDFTGAEKSYATVLEIRSGSPEPCVRLGLMFCRQGRYNDACMHLQRATGAGYETDAVLFSLGYAQAGCGDYDGALGTWRKLQQRHPEDQRLALNIDRLHYLKGRQQVEGEKYEEALASWQEHLKMRPDDEKLKRDIAELYFRLALTRVGVDGSREEARRKLLSAMETDGSHACAPFYMALLELMDGQQAKATQQFGDLSVDGTPSMRHRAMYYQGIGLLHQGDHIRAAEVLRAVAEDPLRAEMDSPVELALAAALARGGNWEESLSELQRIVD